MKKCQSKNRDAQDCQRDAIAKAALNMAQSHPKAGFR